MIQKGKLNALFDCALGANLERFRKQRDMTQDDLGKRIGGVHRNTVMRWEQGEAMMPLCMMMRAADVLRISHLSLLPDRELTWGLGSNQSWTPAPCTGDLPPKKPVQFERDPPLTVKERRFA